MCYHHPQPKHTYMFHSFEQASSHTVVVAYSVGPVWFGTSLRQKHSDFNMILIARNYKNKCK